MSLRVFLVKYHHIIVRENLTVFLEKEKKLKNFIKKIVKIRYCKFYFVM